MASWRNLAGYQATWLLVAWSAGQGRAWIGMLSCAVFIALQLAVSRVRGADVRALLAALVFGSVVDGVAAAGGLIAYASPHPGWPAPAWIVLLWGAFAMTIHHSLAAVTRRPWLAAALGAVGGPLAYVGAARGFGAVVFADPAWPALIFLAGAWAIALPLLRFLAGPMPVAPVSMRGRA